MEGRQVKVHITVPHDVPEQIGDQVEIDCSTEALEAHRHQRHDPAKDQSTSDLTLSYHMLMVSVPYPSLHLQVSQRWDTCHRSSKSAHFRHLISCGKALLCSAASNGSPVSWPNFISSKAVKHGSVSEEGVSFRTLLNIVAPASSPATNSMSNGPCWL